MTQAHAGTRRGRRWRRLVAVLGAVAMLSTGVLDADDAVASSHLPFDVLVNQPTDGTTAYVASVAPRTAGAPAHWQLKLDFQLRSTSETALTVDQVWFTYPGSSVPTWAYEPYRYVNLEENDEKPPIWEERDYVLPADGDDVWVPVFDGVKDVDTELNHPGRELTMPVPDTAVVEITFEEVDETLVRTYDLAVYENDTPTGGLLFPAKAADLGPGEYWHLDTRHTVHEGGWPDVRVGTNRERYALDMVVRHHDGSGWSQLNAAGKAERAAAIAEERDPVYVNEHFLAFGLPVHAMAGGVVTRCAKGHDDHAFTGEFPTKSQYRDRLGNHLVIDHGDAVIIYAHLRFDTIPDALCPGEPGTSRITGLSNPVAAGDQIGEIGNTGRSTGPHTHVEARRSSADGVPFNFLNVRIASDPSTINNLPDPPPLHPVHGATLPSNSLVLPNPCELFVPAGGAAEYARHGVSGGCWQDVVNLAVTAGYAPSYVDAFEDGSDVMFNGVFRHAGPPTIARHGLTGAAYQDLHNELTAAGYRLHQVDSYLQGGAPRIAAIFQQRHGPGWAAHHLLPTAEHDRKVTEYAAAGLAPVNLSWVEIDGQRHWTALFERHSTVTDWDVVTAPATGSAYKDAFDAQVDAGRAPVEVDVQHDGGVPFITAVFAAPFTQGSAARHGESHASHQDHYDANLAAGRLTRAVAGGVYGGTDRYAAVWRGVPDTTVTAAPPALTNSDSATFGFVSSDPYATMECARGTFLFTWQPCTSTTTYDDLPEGSNTFRVRAVDREQFRDPTPATHSWFVDTVAPEVTLLRPAENAMYVHDELESTDEEVTRVVGSVTVVAQALDPNPGSGVAAVTFTVDGVPVPASEVTHDPHAATWSFLWEPPGPGKNMHTIAVTATDHATNSASTSRTVEGTPTGKP